MVIMTRLQQQQINVRLLFILCCCYSCQIVATEVPFRFVDVGRIASTSMHTIDDSAPDTQLKPGYVVAAGIGSYFSRHFSADLSCSYQTTKLAEAEHSFDDLNLLTTTSVIMNTTVHLPIGQVVPFVDIGAGWGSVKLKSTDSDLHVEDKGLIYQARTGVRYWSKHYGIWGVYLSKTFFKDFEIADQRFDYSPISIAISTQF